MHSSFATDRRLLEDAGYAVTTLRELPGFVAAMVGGFDDTVRMEWARDSAFRFFPLLEHEQLGLTLHPFDLATNKVLALVGRDQRRPPVATARLPAVGGLRQGPRIQSRIAARPCAPHHPLLGSRSRTARLPGWAPDAGELARTWRGMLENASSVVDLLPADEAGHCVLTAQGDLCRCSPAHLAEVVAERRVRFHPGSLGGAYPRLVT